MRSNYYSWLYFPIGVAKKLKIWILLVSFKDDKTKIKDFAEKICMDQFADQWVTKFLMSPETFDKLVEELRPFMKKMQGTIPVFLELHLFVVEVLQKKPNVHDCNSSNGATCLMLSICAQLLNAFAVNHSIQTLLISNCNLVFSLLKCWGKIYAT